MSPSAQVIPIPQLLLGFVPALVVMAVYARWALRWQRLAVALVRMVVQLVLVGLTLNFVFSQEHPLFVLAVLTVMLAIAAWIALSPLSGQHRRRFYGQALRSLLIGCVPVVALMAGAVLRLDPWYWPRYLIPLGGMIFANSMNGVSLCAERFESEWGRGVSFEKARAEALQAALLPLTNSLLAVGLVSFPGMMTGQILSGEPPLMAVRYQIMIMSVLVGSVGLSSVWYLMETQRRLRCSFPERLDS